MPPPYRALSIFTNTLVTTGLSFSLTLKVSLYCYHETLLINNKLDYTPVCTTELGSFAKLEPEFQKRGVKLIGLSANTLESHHGWIKDINEVNNTNLTYPIIADKERKVAYLYDMLDYQ